MKLSNRLAMVATLVDINANVIDVGCDHAYLDIYLTLNNQNKCLATDINENALNTAKINIEKYKLKNKIELKLTDGLVDIDVKENDNIIISGMGAYTILDILKTNKLSNTLIISSNNKVDMLRKEIINMGYYIDSELFVIDKDKPYLIIKFKKGLKKYNKIDLLYGPFLKHNSQYKTYLISKERKIYKEISNKKILLKLKKKIEILILKILIK